MKIPYDTHAAPVLGLYGPRPRAQAYYRLELPLRAAFGQGAAVTCYDDRTQAQVDAARLVVLSTVGPRDDATPERVRALIDAIRDGGRRRVLIDVDDEIRAPAGLSDWTPRLLDLFEVMLRHADGLIVTGPTLASRMRRYHRDVRVVPNYVRPGDWGAPTTPTDSGPPWVLLTGSASHDRDWREVEKPLRQLAGRYRLRVAGHLPAYLRDLCHEHRPWGGFDGYPAMIAGCDVALCPLPDSSFNRCKCVTGETLVYTENGLIPIEHLSSTRVSGILIPLSIRVWTTKGWVMTSHFYYGGVQQTLRITTRCGFTIQGTLDHPIRRDTGEWARLDQIAIGDKVMIVPAKFSEQYASLPINTWAMRASEAADMSGVSLPTVRIDENWGKIIGYILGDGNVYRNGVRITCDEQDEDVIADVIETYRNLGIVAKVRARNGEKDTRKCRGVVISSARFNEFLHSIGLAENASSRSKVFAVPGVILRSPRSVIAAFLSALFESDGTVDAEASRISFVTKSRQLAQQVQLLLTGFGIVAPVKERLNKQIGKNYFSIILGRAHSDIFAQEIGFIGARKRGKLQALTAKPHSNRYTPATLADEVVKIEPGEGEVFDVTVPGPAEFGSGGFMSHNTPIKLYETALSGCAVLASPTQYGPILQAAGLSHAVMTVSGLWGSALAAYLDDPARRRADAATLRDYVGTTLDVERHAESIAAAYAA